MSVSSSLKLQPSLRNSSRNNLYDLGSRLKLVPGFGFGCVYQMNISGAYVSEDGKLTLDGITADILNVGEVSEEAYPRSLTVLGSVTAPGIQTLHVVIQSWEPGIYRHRLAANCDDTPGVYLYVFPTQEEAYAAYNQLT